MRTLPAELTAAMDSGSYEPYIKALLYLSNTLTWTLETIIEYELTGDTLSLKAQYTVGVDEYDQLQTVVLRRGVTVEGTNYYIDTSRFQVVEASFDGFYLNIKAELLPLQKVAIYTATYEVVLNEFASQLGFTARFVENVWGNAFLPNGKTLVLNKAKQMKSLLKQKFFASYADDGNNQLVFFSVIERPYLYAPDYEIVVDRLVEIMDNQIVGIGFVGLLWRDENATIYQPIAADFPIYNLGFIHSGDLVPTGSIMHDDDNKVKYFPQVIAPIDIPMNLVYQTGDMVKITSSVMKQSRFGRLFVTEYFNQKKSIKWGLTIEFWDYVANSEGGALPSTIERVAAYTPLVSTGFDGNLTPAVNNLQALAQAVDDLVIGGSGPVTDAANDFQVGDGAGAWIKKTLAEVKAILGLGSLAYLSSLAHSALSGIGTDDHHAKSHVHLSDGSGTVAYSSLSGLPTITNPPATTAGNDFQVGNGAGAWIKKTLAEIKTILGLGTAAYTASSDYAVAAKGVTNGDTHNHVGGDGAVLYSMLMMPCHGLLGTLASGATSYGNPFYYGLGSATGFVVSRSGTLKNLYFKTYDTQSATGSLTATVILTSSGPTVLVVTVAAGAVAGTYSDTAHTVAVSAGEGIYIAIKNNATATSTRIGPMSFELEVATT